MNEGSSLLAKCDVLANPPPTRLYWRLDKTMQHMPSSEGEWDPGQATVHSSISLALSNVTRHLAGSWSCIATNVVHNLHRLSGFANFNLTVYC